MTRYLRTLSILAVSAAAFPLMGAYASGPSYVPQLRLPQNAAMIYNAGNGDYVGYRIVVSPNGNAAAVDGAGRAANELQPDVTQKLFNDLAAAGPLDRLPTGDCSGVNAAAGTTVEVNAAVVITWHGQQTPALTCVTDPKAMRLLFDATTIQHALYVQAYRKRVVVGYGSGYAASGAPYARGGYAYGDSGGFYFDQFRNGQFNFTNFATDSFDFSNFNSEFPGRTTPFTGAPTASPGFINNPFAASPWTTVPSANLPITSPYSANPYSGIGGNAPYVGAPNGTSPYSATIHF